MRISRSSTVTTSKTCCSSGNKLRPPLLTDGCKKRAAKMAALANSLSGVEGTIRRSLNLVPSESAARPCAATDTIDTQPFIKSDPLGLRGANLCKLLIIRCVRCSARKRGR